MEKKLYFCDKCGKQVESEKSLRSAVCGVTKRSVYSSMDYLEVKKCWDMCEDCMKQIGIDFNEQKTPSEQTHIEPSLQDRLYDIFVELVSQTQQGR